MSAPRRFVSLWDMLQLPLGEIVALIRQSSSFGTLLQAAQKNNADVFLPPHAFDHTRGLLDRLLNVLDEMSLATTKGAVQRLLSVLVATPVLDDGRYIFSGEHLTEAKRAARLVGDCLALESVSKVAMILPADKATLYEPSQPHFGAEVRSKFPSAIADIDEAAKCLALGRYTASVFHMMRALEIALKAVHSWIGAASPTNRNWANYLGPIRDERLKRGGTKWSENDFVQDISQHLDAIKDSQRNTTMHVENIYTEEQASLVFRNTRSLMQRIASKMDENGEPKAA